MKVLLLGSGGREHALAWKISQSPRLEKLYALPGNAGVHAYAECLTGIGLSPREIAGEAERLKIDLTVVGPEQPLVDGVADEFEKRGLLIVGPTAAAAQLEGSKIFAKQFMSRHAIPTAAYHVCSSAESARAVLHSSSARFPLVIKADGLAAGKGVVIAQSREEAARTIEAFMVERVLGSAGQRVVIEECLTGREASFLLFTDGKRIAPMVAAQDYKRAFDGDRGPNTGGMGSISRPQLLDEATREQILRDIAQPTINGLAAEGLRYRGILYIGLMLTPAGPRVLEFNVRFGDPETQVILKRMASDLLVTLASAASGELENAHPLWNNAAAVCVVAASEGYPGTYAKGKVIHGLEQAAAIAGVNIFHAGTERNESGEIVTSGGRVLGITASGTALEEARQRAYESLRLVRFDGMRFRSDIGQMFEEPLHKEERA